MNADEATDTIDAARRLQRARERAAKASPERRFHARYDQVYREDILERAWEEGRDGQNGVDFLGLHHRQVASWRWRGKRYLQQWPGQRAMHRVRDRVNAITTPRYRLKEPSAPIVGEINRVLRGWGAYFRVGNAVRQFAKIDRYVRMRVGRWLSKKTGRTGRRWQGQIKAMLATLGLYHLRGTVAWTTATPRAGR